MILTEVPGLTTKFISFLQSLVPSFSRKKPELIAFLESSRFKKATAADFRGRAIYPYCPGSTAPKLSRLGNFNNDLLFI